MKKKLGWKKRGSAYYALLLLFLLLSSNDLFADGSRDLYPSGASGYRAFLRSSTGTTSSWPFANEGTHYVYAKQGERITLASSAQNGGTGRIRLYAPDGSLVVNNTTGGQITNRTGELAGPQLFGQNVAGRYTPIYYSVNTDGIYRVEFVSRSTGDPSTTIDADASWTQASNNAGIAAWDISVINSGNTAFVKGRVYTNIFNLSNGTGNPNTGGFYGLIYVLTKDGYTYKVNNNGNNGLYFTFFVNNDGFINPGTNEPLYKSLDQSTPAFLAGKVHDPNTEDTQQHITHKLFYSLPANDLPVMSTGAVPGGSTWLKNAVIPPDVSSLQLIGVDGTPGQVSNKGGYIRFSAGALGQYKIMIESTASPAAFATRILSGASSTGVNNIFWNGKDGAGNPLPTGVVPSKITVQLQGAEVHFPLIDMEYNENGTIIELLNHNNLNAVVSDVIYWDDTDVPNGTVGNNAPRGRFSDPKNNSHLSGFSGVSSNSNGHIWGQGGTGTSGLFGDNRSIDTWTFIPGTPAEITADVTVKVADLKVTQLVADKTSVVVGDQLIYTVKVKNDGPSNIENAPFTFSLPSGFNHQNVQFQGNGCGTQGVAITYNSQTGKYSSKLNLPNGCEITYVFTVGVTATTSGASQQAEATILRPNDVTDPDATNTSLNIPPADPHFECDNNGLSTACNNIRVNQVAFVSGPICTEQVDGSDFSTQDGDTVTFAQPATDYGFQFDIYSLDNSFNLVINGTQLASQEIEFQASGTAGQNIRFVDGSIWEDGTVPDIWELTGSASAPIVRVVISPTGVVTMYGSKTSGGPLFPLELFNGNSFNSITWNTTAPNTVVASQSVIGGTNMTGHGNGVKIVPCYCTKPGATGTPERFGRVGVLTKSELTVANWPKSVPNGYLVIDSANKGLVITHMTTAQRDALIPVKGMLIYNTDLKCVQLYRGQTPGVDNPRQGWNCIERGCNEEL
jgi:uncharacterized repeat protein (TIGR01451 family)